MIIDEVTCIVAIVLPLRGIFSGARGEGKKTMPCSGQHLSVALESELLSGHTCT